MPAVWAAMAFRTHPILLAAVAGIVFLFGCFMGYDVMSCLCILGMAAPAGCCLWYSQKENLGNFQSVLYVSVLMTFGLFLVFCVPDLVATGDPYASIRACCMPSTRGSRICPCAPWGPSAPGLPPSPT